MAAKRRTASATRPASSSTARAKAGSTRSRKSARRGATVARPAIATIAPKTAAKANKSNKSTRARATATTAAAKGTTTKRSARPAPTPVPGTPKTPAQYIASLPLDRGEIVQALHDAICAAAPSLEPHLCGRILGFGRYHYKYASGREGDWFVVGLASQKNYLSLFLCAHDKNGYLAEQHARRLGNVSVGKSCIRFKRIEDLNVELALDLVRQAEALAKASGGFAM